MANPTRNAFKKLAQTRIKEARILLKNRAYSGAYYLAGYAVECAFKAVIAKEFTHHTWPEKEFVNKIYVHDLAKLLKLSKLESAFDDDVLRKPSLRTNWELIKEWSEQSRYDIRSEFEAKTICDAIDNRADGILTWLQDNW